MAKKQTDVDLAQLYKSLLSRTSHANTEFSRDNLYLIKDKVSNVAVSHSIDQGLQRISQVKADEFLKLSVAKWTWKKNKKTASSIRKSKTSSYIQIYRTVWFEQRIPLNYINTFEIIWPK